MHKSVYHIQISPLWPRSNICHAERGLHFRAHYCHANTSTHCAAHHCWLIGPFGQTKCYFWDVFSHHQHFSFILLHSPVNFTLLLSSQIIFLLSKYARESMMSIRKRARTRNKNSRWFRFWNLGLFEKRPSNGNLSKVILFFRLQLLLKEIKSWLKRNKKLQIECFLSHRLHLASD